MSEPKPTLTGPTVVLRPIDASDAPAMAAGQTYEVDDFDMKAARLAGDGPTAAPQGDRS